jgi:hypothetical protein
MHNHEEYPFIQFVRAGILLFALIAVPGIAVCWNVLPKYNFPKYNFHSIFFEDNKPEQQNNSEVNPLQPKRIQTNNIPELPVLFGKTNDTAEIRTASGERNDEAAAMNIPAAFVPSPAEWASAVASNAQTANEIDNTQENMQTAVPVSEPKTDYPALEKELNLLGAKYYRLEKWGRQGDLFRFSCYVSPNSEITYQKYFQAIDADEIRVMQRVVNEIKQWKQSSGY